MTVEKTGWLGWEIGPPAPAGQKKKDPNKLYFFASLAILKGYGQEADRQMVDLLLSIIQQWGIL